MNEKQRLLTTQEHLTPATQEVAVSMTEDERLLLMNIPQLLTQATQEVAAADASVAGFTQNHSSSQEDVTAATGFDALVQEQQAIMDDLQQKTSGPDRQKAEGFRDAQSLMNAPISSQLTQDHSDDGGRFGKDKSDPLVPDDSTVSDDKDANIDDHHTATDFVGDTVTATSSAATVVLREGGKPVIHTTHTTTKTIDETLVEDLNISTQMTEDTSDDGGMEEDKKRDQI